MAKTKASLSGQKNIAHQQALVQTLLSKTVKPIKRSIPGGVNMLSELDQQGLESACYTWLRGTRHFTSVKISLANDPDKFRLAERKIVDFPTTGQHPVWVTHPDGKRYLAELMASALKSTKLVTVEAKKDGLYITTDSDQKFSPTREATGSDVAAVSRSLQEGEEAPFGVGDQIWNEDWEPYVEFIPERRNQYG